MNPRAEEVNPRAVRPARILLVDDEQRVLRFVSRGLRAEGYVVESADNGADGLRMALTAAYDLIILDLLMPGLDGESVLRRIIRRLPSQQVMVVSCLTETATKVGCFEQGAVDYLAKPFSLDELLARVQAHLRVVARTRSATRLEAGQLELDMVRREADSGSGPVPLAEREFLLLSELMQHAGQTVSKERLLSSVWQYHFDSGSNVVDVYVGRLRAKLGAQAIRTVRGKGYQVDGGGGGPQPPGLAVAAVRLAGGRLGRLRRGQPGRDVAGANLGDGPVPLHLDQPDRGLRLPGVGSGADRLGAGRGGLQHRRPAHARGLQVVPAARRADRGAADGGGVPGDGLARAPPRGGHGAGARVLGGEPAAPGGPAALRAGRLPRAAHADHHRHGPRRPARARDPRPRAGRERGEADRARGRDPARRQTRGWPGGGLGRRLRPWHRAGAARGDLRPLRQAGRRAQPRPWRRRPGPGDRQGDRRGARRVGPGPQRAGPRQRLRGPPARPAGAAGGGGQVTSVLTAWTFDPMVVAGLGAAGVLYLRGVRRVRHPDRKLANRAACFIGGLVVIWIALQSPIDSYADTRLSVHMGQHLLLTMIAAPLLVLGAPVTLLLRAATPAVRRRWVLPLLRSRPVRLLTAPVVSWAQFALVLWVSHFSPLYEAAVRSTGVHALEHMLYIASAVLFWSPVAGLDPSPKRLSHPARLLYLFLAMPQASFLGLAMWGTSRVLYPSYQAALGAAALDDQRLAGTIMGSAGMLVMVPALGLVVLDWLAREEREAVRTDARLGVEGGPR